MKTLDQIEARTPISTPGFAISRPGSYYLTTNLICSTSSGIVIATNNVTLDLNGFVIDGSHASGHGIYVDGLRKNLRIENGTVSGCFYDGISAYNASDSVIREVRVSGCCRTGIVGYRAIVVGQGCRVERCRVLDNRGSGIVFRRRCTVVDNEVRDNDAAGLATVSAGSIVARNEVFGNGDNYDFAAGNRLELLLCEVPETLSRPCSVRFAGSLISSTGGGISVNSDDVTIDLCGHALVGPGTSGQDGIHQNPSFRNLCVKNGAIVGWGGSNRSGVCALGSNARFENLSVVSNYYGIKAEENCTIVDCAIRENALVAISVGSGSTVRGCSAANNGSHGFLVYSNCTISDCSSCENGGYGISAYGGGCAVTSCSANHNAIGIYAGYGCTVKGCTANNNARDGILCRKGSLVCENVCAGNGTNGTGAGIKAEVDDCRIDSNNVVGNDIGIKVDASGNVIVRNVASGNATDYDVVSGNAFGVVQTSPSGAGAWDNFSF